MNIKFGRIVASYAVGCGKCKQAHESILGAESLTEAHRRAREAGWVLTRAWGWICEECDR